MPPLTFILAVLLALIQYPLWWGHGGWRSVHRLEHQLTGQQRINARLKQRNEQYAGEVRDLEQGTAAIEERARMNWEWSKKARCLCNLFLPQARPEKTGCLPEAGQLSADSLIRLLELNIQGLRG